MITAWRIVATRYADTAFTGRSAGLAGGRWNSRGTELVYTSSSAALAALELLVHLTRRSELHDRVVFACTFEDDLVQRVDMSRLPANWASVPSLPALRGMGDRFVTESSSAILQVPSAIIPSEFNYLLNPTHPDFAKVSIAEPIPFSLDLRLLRR